MPPPPSVELPPDVRHGRLRRRWLRRATVLGHTSTLLLGAAVALLMAQALPVPYPAVVLTLGTLGLAAATLALHCWHRANLRTQQMAPEHRGRRSTDWQQPW
jgi:uncharacterized membrane protein YdbT with pleckstrin-like domain